jgi:hypothetical protein
MCVKISKPDFSHVLEKRAWCQSVCLRDSARASERERASKRSPATSTTRQGAKEDRHLLRKRRRGKTKEYAHVLHGRNNSIRIFVYLCVCVYCILLVVCKVLPLPPPPPL